MSIVIPYEEWKTVSQAQIQSAADPLKMVSRVMIAMTEKMGDLLRSIVNTVNRLTREISEINALLTLVNSRVATNTNPDGGAVSAPTDNFHLISTTSELEARTLYERFIRAGVKMENGKPQLLLLRYTGTKWIIELQKQSAEQFGKDLMNLAADKTNSNQQEQVSLNTIIGRFNGAIEAASNAIKKSEVQAEAAMHNMKR